MGASAEGGRGLESLGNVIIVSVTVLSSRNIIWATGVIINYLVATS